MGRLTLIYALIALIPAATHVLGQTLDVATCEELAKKAGKPLDGWQVVTDDDGSQHCQRTTVDLLCAGEQIYNPTTRKASCCDPPSVVTWTDQPKKLAYCCAKGHQWVGDTASGAGGCCPIGFTWDNGKCKDATPPPPPPLGDCVTQCPTENSAACGGSPTCANAQNLGIKYGHCYILSFGDGTQLGAQRDDGNTYAKGGYFQDIPFEVCKSPTDCSDAGPVPHDGTFCLEDQTGRFNDATGKLGWIGSALGGAHMAWTDQPASAAIFKGSASCAGGQCGVQLTGGSTPPTGVGATCPTDQHGITFWSNPKVGINLRFTEVRCDGKSKFAPVA